VRTTLASTVLGLNLDNLVGLLATGQVLTGNVLGNAITGGAGNDTLNGGLGADTLTGGAGVDRLLGGVDGDLYVVGAGDLVVEALNAGQDTVVATEGTSWTLAANTEVLVLQGATLVTGVGNALANLLLGNSGNNLLSGGAGADALSGAQGADTLVGGAGADTLTGGLGADVFRITLAADSAPLAADRIADFVFADGDRIDLRFIDANVTAAAIGNEAFAYIGAAAFGGLGAASAGQLRVIADGAGQWQALGDTNGDGIAELRIHIVSATAPTAGWFLA
jgi:Ca2+-binding RTX toxin-like protein